MVDFGTNPDLAFPVKNVNIKYIYKLAFYSDAPGKVF